MIYRLIILCNVIFLWSFAYSQQVNKEGIPLITNYTPKQYNAHNENWMSVVNKYGIMYFANTSGSILEYDGNKWNLIPSKLKMVIYSLACDTNGVVYVGSMGDFGCIKPDFTGKLKYYSLVDTVIASEVLKQTFWKTYIGKNQEVYFCSPSYIYKYKSNKVNKFKLPKNSWLSFYINDSLYISNRDSGLLVFEHGNFKQVKGFHVLKNSDIQLIEELNSKTWLIFNGNNFFKYDIETNKCFIIDENLIVLDYLKKNYAYHNFNFKNDLRVWSTINGGIVISTNKWRTNYILNDTLGLSSSQVSSVNYNHIDGTIWATTLNGISKVEFQNPLRVFGSEHALKGNIYNVKRFKGKLYVATSSGLFVLDKNIYNSSFKKVDFFKDNVVNTLEIVYFNNDEKLFVASQSSLFEFDGKNFYKISGKNEFIAECIFQTKNKTVVYIGTQNGLFKCTYNNQKYTIEKVQNLNEYISSIIEDENESIWFSTLSNGVYSLSKEGLLKHYTTSHGLPELNDVFLSYYKGEILFCTMHGLYTFNRTTNKIEKCNSFGDWINSPNYNIISCYRGFNNQMWFNINDKLYLLTPNFNSYNVDSITFMRLPKLVIYHVYSELTGTTWIGTNEGLFSYNNKTKIPNTKFYALIRNVSLSNDSVIFHGTYYHPTNKISFVQDKTLNKFVLDYKYNSINVVFAAPYYQEENKVEFSYKLEGFDNQWSNWTKENKAKYTNLPEGIYTFKVKARNIYFQESEISTFTFEINPPWYRTKLAYVSYVLLIVLFFITSIKLYTRKLEADKRRLEIIVEERTAEIVKQKNEIEIKNKEIEQKNKDITDSIYYAKRIQEAILPPKEYIQGAGVDIFIYFRPKDIVSGDFYFIRNINSAKVLLVAAADCTGHGVPGAFMSMLGTSILNELVSKPEINHTDIILNELRKVVIKSLNPEGKEYETKDGMDISLIAYYYENYKLEFSCANNPLYHIRNKELFEYKADKMPVGLYELRNQPFSRNEIQIIDGDIVYLFSDGFADQFGGENGKKYLYKRFKEFLLSIHHLPLNEQEKLIELEMNQWKGDREQIDDQLIIGIKFNVS